MHIEAILIERALLSFFHDWVVEAKLQMFINFGRAGKNTKRGSKFR